jgi:putative transport protein
VEIDLYQLLQNSPELTVFAVIGFGYLVGRIPIGSVRLENVAGVLVAGAVFGHFGLGQGAFSFQLGFILFIYCVGLQAGPHFFSVFARDGKNYIALVGVTALAAVVLTTALGWLFGLDSSLRVGALAGALTSTPTLAGAQDAVRSGLVSLPPGRSTASTVEQIAIAYAVTYLFGTGGLLMLVRLVPRWLRIDLAREASEASRKMRLRMPEEDDEEIERLRPMIRAYEVTSPDLIGKSLRELRLPEQTGALLYKVKRGDELLAATADLELHERDRVSVLAPFEAQVRAREAIGPAVLDADLVDVRIDTRDIVVTRADVAGQSIAELDLIRGYGCIVLGVSRSLMELPVTPQLQLQRGDTIRAMGPREQLDRMAGNVGQVERNAYQTDLITFAFGIAAGLLLGTITVKVGRLPVGLGMAGGLLLSGILVGFLRVSNPTIGRMPRSVSWLFMEFGLMVFMAGIGLRAGPGIVAALQEVGLQLFFMGVVLTTATLAIGFAFGRWVLGMNPALLLGAMTGAMTSTPALGIVTRLSRSGLPSVGYAGTYPFANIVLTLVGTLLMRA